MSRRSFHDKLLYDLEGGDLQAPLQKANDQLILYVLSNRIVLTVIITGQTRFY